MTKLTQAQAYTKVYSALDNLITSTLAIKGEKLTKKEGTLANLDVLIADFVRVIKEDFEAGRVDETVVNQLNSMWMDSSERFQMFQLNQYFKRAKTDAMTWMQGRHKWDPKVQEKNAQLLKLFES